MILIANLYRELGSSGIRTSGGGIQEEFLPKLRFPRAADIYQEMASNDPVITAILLCSRQLIRNIKWEVVPASENEVDKQNAKFLEQCKDDLDRPWTSFIDELLSYFEYGWSLHEIVYKKRSDKTSKFADGKIGWAKIAGRSQHSLDSWEINDVGEILGMWQYTTNGSRVFIPMDRALLFRTTTARDNPEGKSWLRGAYRPWYYKKHIEEIEGIGIERDLAGLPVIKLPDEVDFWDDSDENLAGNKIKNEALGIVSSIRRDSNEGVVLPPGWGLELLTTGGSRQFDTSAIINRYDQRIAITMLADIVMLGADKVGSFALANVKQSMLSASLDAQVLNIVDIINEQAVQKLFDLNTMDTSNGYPKFKASSVVSLDLTALGNYIKALSGANMELFPDENLENYLRELIKAPTVPEGRTQNTTQEGGTQTNGNQGNTESSNTEDSE